MHVDFDEATLTDRLAYIVVRLAKASSLLAERDCSN